MLLLEKSWQYDTASIQVTGLRKKYKILHSCMVNVIFLNKGIKSQKYWRSRRQGVGLLRNVSAIFFRLLSLNSYMLIQLYADKNILLIFGVL